MVKPKGEEVADWFNEKVGAMEEGGRNFPFRVFWNPDLQVHEVKFRCRNCPGCHPLLGIKIPRELNS